MAYTLAYQESNGITITAGDTHFLTVNLYRMKSDYTYDQILEDQIIAVDEVYTLNYPSDGVYKITILESGTTFNYADINYCTYLGSLGTSLKNNLCCTIPCDFVDYKNPLNLIILGNRYFGEITYTIFSTADFSNSVVIADLRGIRDCIERTTIYGANITDLSCS